MRLEQALTEERRHGSTLEEELLKERRRGSTLEEALNETLAEQRKLQKRILELESTMGELNAKLAEREVQLSKSVSTEPWHEEVGLQDQGAESLGSPLLTPVKNYWTTPVKSQSGRRWSGRSPSQSGSSHAFAPIPFFMDKVTETEDVTEALKMSAPESSLDKGIESSATSTSFHSVEGVNGWTQEVVTPGNMLTDSLEYLGSGKDHSLEVDNLSNILAAAHSAKSSEQIHTLFQSLATSNRFLQERVAQLTQEIAVSSGIALVC